MITEVDEITEEFLGQYISVGQRAYVPPADVFLLDRQQMIYYNLERTIAEERRLLAEIGNVPFRDN